MNNTGPFRFDENDDEDLQKAVALSLSETKTEDREWEMAVHASMIEYEKAQAKIQGVSKENDENQTNSKKRKRSDDEEDDKGEVEETDDSEGDISSPKRMKKNSGDSAPPALNYTLSEEQQRVMDIVMKGENVFFTGEAGVGKSHLLRALLLELRRKHPYGSVAATAFSGMAASNIGGCTLHSFSSMLVNDSLNVHQMVGAMLKNKAAVQRWEMTKVIIIDEISMIADSDIEILDRVARVARDDERPFGGIQVIMSGDFLQLPPIESDEDSGKYTNFSISQKGSARSRAYCFSSPIWKKLFTRANQFLLVQNHRQEEDDGFKEILREVRVGNVTTKVYSQLQRRVAKPDQKRLIYDVRSDYTLIAFFRNEARDYNNERLAKLPGPKYTYVAIDNPSPQFKGTADTMERLSPLLTRLELKIGSRVMLTANKNVTGGLFNGKQGRVVAFILMAGEKQQSPVVLFDGDNAGMEHIISSHRFEYSISGKLMFTRYQIPLILSWALTAHKAQGQTLEKVAVKCTKSFANGQFYTAISRCKKLSGLYLLDDFDQSYVMASPEAVTYWGELNIALNNTNEALQKSTAAKTPEVQEEDFDLYVY